MSHRCLLTFLLVLLVPGCPATPEEDDTGTDNPDTSVTDAGNVDDAPAVTDADEDGIPSDRDCDDTNPDIGSSGTRSCDGPCGPGVAACIDGEWRDCEASTDCLCPTNGMTRTIACGTMCGTRTDTCTELRWVEGASCDEGECEAGEIETTHGIECSESRRVCSDVCAWGEVEVVTEPQGCEPGDIISCIRHRRCDDDCQLEEFDTDPRCP